MDLRMALRRSKASVNWKAGYNDKKRKLICKGKPLLENKRIIKP